MSKDRTTKINDMEKDELDPTMHNEENAQEETIETEDKIDMQVSHQGGGFEESEDTVEYDQSPLDVLRAGLEQNRATVADLKLDELMLEALKQEDAEGENAEKGDAGSELFVRKTVALTKEERLEMLGFCDDDSEDPETVIVTDADLDSVHERAQQLGVDFSKQDNNQQSAKSRRGVISSDLRNKFVPEAEETVPPVFHAMGDVSQTNENKSETMFGGNYFNNDQTMRYAPKSKPRRAFSANPAMGEDKVEILLRIIAISAPIVTILIGLLYLLLSD